MDYIGGIQESFQGSTGTLNYNLVIAKSDTTSVFQFSFGNSGIDPENPSVSGMNFLTLSGYKGKLYDNEGNYFHSYSPLESTDIEGNIFSGYHNYSVGDTIINTNCQRRTGEINSFYYSGISRGEFSCLIKEHQSSP